jgi:hypothetical protein
LQCSFEVDAQAGGTRLKRVLPSTPQEALLMEPYFRLQPQ